MKHSRKFRSRPAAVVFSLLAVLAIYGCMQDSRSEPDESAEPEPAVISIFINHPWYSVDSFTGIIPDEIKRITGVTLEVEIAVDSHQLGMKIASSQLPDLIYTSEMIDVLSNSSISQCYDDLIERYNIDWDIDPGLRANAMAFNNDGKLYTILNHYTSTSDWADTHVVPMVGSMSVRQDILDSLGNPPINTFDDLMNVFGMVKENNPDMVPFTFHSTHRFNVLLSWIGLGTVSFAEQEDGDYLYYVRDKRYKELMKILNRMYQNGYLLPENFADEPTKVQFSTPSLYDSGKAFSISTCTQNSNVNSQVSLSRLNPSYLSVEMAPIRGAKFDVANLGWSGTFITVANNDPESSIEFIRWMFTPEAQKLTQWGREGIEYTLNAHRLPVFSDEVLQSIADNTYTQRYNPWFYLGASAIFESEGRCGMLPWELYEKPYSEIRQKYRNLSWIAAAMPIGGIPEHEIYKRISGSVENYETRLILSETDEDFENAFDRFMKDMNMMGVERLEEYMTKKIPELKKTYDAVPE